MTTSIDIEIHDVPTSQDVRVRFTSRDTGLSVDVKLGLAGLTWLHDALGKKIEDRREVLVNFVADREAIRRGRMPLAGSGEGLT